MNLYDAELQIVGDFNDKGKRQLISDVYLRRPCPTLNQPLPAGAQCLETAEHKRLSPVGVARIVDCKFGEPAEER